MMDSRLKMTMPVLLLLLLADYQSTTGLTLEGLNVTSTTAISTPVELTHLFMNKDGTLDSSKLFNSVNQFFPKKTKTKENEVFKTENNTSMKAHSGSTIVLPCLVEKEGQFEMIMWARQLEGANKSYQILTIGESTHINDNRFLIPKSTVNNDWSLRIQRVEPSDSGAYKCQANSHPPQFITTYLSIHEAYAEIDGPREKFIKAGSALVLNCTFRRLTQRPEYVFWYHNDMMISHEKSRGQSVIFKANFSTLRLPQVTQKDSGNYTCAPHNMRPHLITVQVLGGSQSRDGEETAAAAVQDDNDVLLVDFSPATMMRSSYHIFFSYFVFFFPLFVLWNGS